MLPERSEGKNRPLPIRSQSTTDTRIFSRELDRLRPYISMSYRGVRCPICSTMQDCAQLVHAKLTHGICAPTAEAGAYLGRIGNSSS